MDVRKLRFTALASGILLALFISSAAADSCPMGDLNEDCKVDWQDVKLLALQWLDVPECSGPGCADFDGVGRIDGSDFALFALDWRKDHRVFWLVINEFMAANNGDSGVSDEHGDYDDWIEIYNSWSERLDIGGLYITDDLDEPTKWKIPANSPAKTTIDPNGHIVLWADGETSEGVRHLPFKLDAGGEAIGLFALDGSTEIDSIEFVDQTANISYGRTPDANEHWQYMVVPTPAAENNNAYTGIVADTEFSHNRGFYEAPFNVVLATETGGASIYYTTDGNAPIINEMLAPGALLYSGPIPITTTTCLRAGAIKTGYRATNVDAQTYIFLADVKQQSDSSAYARGFPVWWVNKYGDVTNPDYAMDPDVVNNPAYSGVFTHAMKAIPTISLATDKKHLFNKMTGIYVNPGEYHNPYYGGQDWERPVSAEYFDPCTGDQFQINGGVRIVGNQSRWTLNPKHSFRLTFTSEYGSTKLDFPLFENTDVETHNTISLRAQYHMSWVSAGGDPPVIVGDGAAQYLRDTFAQDSIRDMGYASPDSKLVHLYINGLYWGIYQASERPDDDFMAEHLGGAPDDYEVVEGILGGVDGVEHKDALGDQTWHYIWNYITAHNYDSPVSDSEYAVIEQYIDMTQMVDYIVYMTWAVNWDWCSKNWYAASLRGPTGQPPAGKWRFYPWDSEITLGWYSQMQGFPFSGYYNAGPGKMHNAMHKNQYYNRLFGDRVHKLCANGGVLTTQPSVERYQKRAELIEDAVIGESARWGDFAKDQNGSSSPLYTRDDHWTPQRDWLVSTFFPGKTSYIIGAYRGYGLYPTVSAPVFNVNGSYKHGGYISATDQISMTTSAGTIYYTIDGNDVLADPNIEPPPPPVEVILAAENASKRVKVPTTDIGTAWHGGSEPYNDASWTLTTGGVGYDTTPDFDPYFTLDVQNEMYNIMESCYIRIPFTVNAEELPDYTALKLRLRYEDGFVAFINGSMVASDLAPSPLLWYSGATGYRDEGQAIQLTDFYISEHLDKLHAGTNILAIHGLNRYTGSSDFLISAQLEAVITEGSGGPSEPNMSGGTILYTGAFSLPRSAVLRARALSGGQWSALNDATYVVGPVVSALRITEIMYNPLDVNAEYVELKNISGSAVNLNLLRFSNGIDFTFPSASLPAGQHILVVKSRSAFEAKYGTGRNIAGEYSGSLENAGERIRLEDGLAGTILDFEYKDGWRDITDGGGYSLTIINPANGDVNSWSKKDSWRASAYVDGSPGWDDSGIVPNPGSVVINEVMSHSHANAPDWIELYNATGSPVNIGNWYLSDSDSNVMKYKFASGTTISAYGYVVVYEDVNFGLSSNDPGKLIPFALSENGDMVCVSSGLDANGLLTGYRSVEDFGASETGVSFGRYYKASTNSYNFVPMDHNTPRAANAYPKVGPIVITEIMYHPDWPASSPYGNDEYEFIELRNISGSPVTLYDTIENESWKFTDGIDYTFADSPPVTIAAGVRIVVVKNPAAFSWRYPSVPSGIIYGPYDGRLANEGEKLELGMPGDVDEAGQRQYIRVERVDYSDGSHPGDEPGDTDPWPTQADGQGKSLTRISTSAYGNDPNNFSAVAPSPGT